MMPTLDWRVMIPKSNKRRGSNIGQESPDPNVMENIFPTYLVVEDSDSE
jgi:hypothetical protein